MTAETGRPHTAWSARGTLVYLPNRAGGFELRDCPNPEKLAAQICLACNLFPDLVAALEEAKTAIVNCHEWRSHNHHAALRTVDAALLKARSVPPLTTEG